MNDLAVCLNAVLPIFLTMAAGYAARRAGLLDGKDVKRMNSVAFNAFFPVMAFYNVYTSDLSTAFDLKLIGFAVGGVLLACGLAAWLTGRLVKEPARRGVIIQGIFRSNFVIIGLPLVQNLVGDGELGPVSVLLAVVVPLFNVLAIVTLSVNGGQKTGVKSTLLGIVKNPLIVGTALGLLALGLGVRLPAPVLKVTKDMAGATSPLMLFLLGAFFEFGNLRHSRGALWTVCAVRLLLLPGAALSAAYLLGIRAGGFAALIGVFGAPTAVASFTMAQQMGGDAELAGNIVVMTSALCSFTLFLWIYLFKILGAF